MEEKDYAGDITEQWGNDPVVNLRFDPVRKAFDEDPLVVSREVSPYRVFRRPPFQWENSNLLRLAREFTHRVLIGSGNVSPDAAVLARLAAPRSKGLLLGRQESTVPAPFSGPAAVVDHAVGDKGVVARGLPHLNVSLADIA